jgi:Immunity protein 27
MKINALQPLERELKGRWTFNGSSVEADKVSKRIEYLINTYLIKVAEDNSGWGVLFQDPDDGRYWELTYPESEFHGGGAPLLQNLSLDEVRNKYINFDGT